MPQQFVVPQFLDMEAKIIGPVTARQFVISIVTFVIAFLVYALSPIFFLTVVLDIVVVLSGIILAFIRVNGVPMHLFLLSIIQTMKRPGLRVWDKTLTDAEIKALTKKILDKKPMEEIIPVKQRPSGSRLSELTMIVNTGGVYQPDESILGNTD